MTVQPRTRRAPSWRAIGRFALTVALALTDAYLVLVVAACTGGAVRLAADHPARALVLESPFTSTVEVAELHYPFLPSRLLMWDRYESAAWIGNVHMPVLVVHGEADRLIPIAMGRRLYDLANPPKSFVAIPGGGHDDLPDRGFYDDVWRFLGVAAPPVSTPRV